MPEFPPGVGVEYVESQYCASVYPDELSPCPAIESFQRFVSENSAVSIFVLFSVLISVLASCRRSGLKKQVPVQTYGLEYFETDQQMLDYLARRSDISELTFPQNKQDSYSSYGSE